MRPILKKSVLVMVLFNKCLAIIIDSPQNSIGPSDYGLDWNLSPSALNSLDLEGILFQHQSSVGNSGSSSLTGFVKDNIKKNTIDVTPKDIKEVKDFRLPNDVLPNLYSIQLLPHLENATTDGQVDILVDCIKETKNISLNSRDINIHEQSIKITNVATGFEMSVEKFIDEQIEREMIIIQLKELLEPGRQYQISLKFVSKLNIHDGGFFRVSYVENNTTKYLAATQFESTHARRAFPCFDEPNFKARFSVTLGRKVSMKTASNMRIVRTSDMIGKPGYVWDCYETSVIMSSYLVAFLVSEFVAVTSPPGLYRIPFRIWTRPDYVNQTQYSLDRAPRIQKYFEEYFEIPFPLSKQDFMAIQGFGGAMENWGLVTFGERYLLVDPMKTKRVDWQLTAEIISHELAHQWFGNLMTTDWWDTIWLNEGFASYFTPLGLDAVEPDWLVAEQFLTDDLQMVLLYDSLENSRPISMPVVDPAKIDNMFDRITYVKGGSVIRMMADFLGKETFRLGLKRFLNDRAFGNAIQDDLWHALQDQAMEDHVSLPGHVKDIMDSWTLQMGFPVINVTRNYGYNTTQISQERFLSRKNVNGSQDDHIYRWWVPLTYVTENNPTKKISTWLTNVENHKTIVIEGDATDNWVLVNVDQQNYYRVNYDEKNYELLNHQLISNHQVISKLNRAQILDDVFNLALADMIPYSWALNISTYLKQERDYVPWRAILSEIDYLDVMLYGSSEFVDWRNYLSGLFRPYFEHVGFAETSSDSHLTILSRIDALNWACKVGVPSCVSHVKDRFKAHMKQPDVYISPNQRTQILRYGVEYGGKKEWDFAWQQYNLTGDTEYLIAMIKTRQTKNIENMLELVIDPTGLVRERGHSDMVFRYIAGTPMGNEMAFKFLTDRWDDIKAQLGSGALVRFYTSLHGRINNQNDMDRFVKLRDDHYDILGSSSDAESAIKTVHNNIKWVATNKKEIEDWVERFVFKKEEYVWIEDEITSIAPVSSTTTLTTQQPISKSPKTSKTKKPAKSSAPEKNTLYHFSMVMIPQLIVIVLLRQGFL